VEDDGRGIDPDKVRRSAVERGIISAEEATQLDDDQAIDLIFRPNLSTAETITEVSGRGVGMDVVRANIERLGGSVTVDSKLGSGTTFWITLPLTLAIVQAMLVSVNENVYAIPLTGVIEALYLAEVRINKVKGRPTILWRNSVLPLLDLREYFDDGRPKRSPNYERKFDRGYTTATRVKMSLQGRRPEQSSLSIAETAPPAARSDISKLSSQKYNGKTAVVTVTWGKQRVGLVVDGIIGNEDIVVKSLSPIMGELPGLSGAAILGDGRIALIVDVPGLISSALQSRG